MATKTKAQLQAELEALKAQIGENGNGNGHKPFGADDKLPDGFDEVIELPDGDFIGYGVGTFRGVPRLNVRVLYRHRQTGEIRPAKNGMSLPVGYAGLFEKAAKGAVKLAK